MLLAVEQSLATLLLKIRSIYNIKEPRALGPCSTELGQWVGVHSRVTLNKMGVTAIYLYYLPLQSQWITYRETQWT